MAPTWTLPAFALAGVTASLFLPTLFAAPLVPLSELATHEGGRIATEATVRDVHHGRHGRAIELTDGHVVATALARPGDGPAPGDLIRAVGLVTRLDDGLGLSLRSFSVIKSSTADVLRVGDVAAAPHLFAGSVVRMAGDVRGESLVGEDARIRWTGEAPPEPGWWVGEGLFQYDRSRASYVFRVDAWTRWT